MDIGFIGLGNMGFHMARRLLAAGHSVIALDTRKDVLDRMVALGASAAGSPKEVADRAETVMASLPTPDIVLQVATGPGGIIEGQRVRRFVDLSTTGSNAAREVAAALAAKGITAVDAPVSGGPTGAEKGTLAMMIGAPRAVADELRPIIEVLGKFFHIGEEPGLGQTMKVINNLMSATAQLITAEAMVMGVKAGLDPTTMLNVINAGSGRNTATESKFPKNVLPGTFDLGFTNGLMAKDVGLALSEAKALGVPVQACEAVAALLTLTCDELGPDSDITTVIQPIEKRAGVEVRSPKP